MVVLSLEKVLVVVNLQVVVSGSAEIDVEGKAAALQCRRRTRGDRFSYHPKKVTTCTVVGQPNTTCLCRSTKYQLIAYIYDVA